MTNNHIFWIGIQESEIKHTGDLFSGSITIFGTNKNGNYAYDKEFNIRYNYNIDNDSWITYVNEVARKIVQVYPNCSFMLYYPMDAAFYDKIITNRMLAVNDPLRLDLWDNKFRCREWLGNSVSSVPTEIYPAERIISDFQNRLSGGKKYVIQSEYSCGGSDTWLLTAESMQDIFCRIDIYKRYAISQYMEHSFSVNMHIIVYSDEVILLPASMQIISSGEFNFEYCGADFIAYRHLPKHIRNKVREYSLIIGERLRRSNYLGVCGIDYMVTDSAVYFSEINPRFQSSTFLINMALNDAGLSTSVQQLHIDSFKNSKCSLSIMPLTVEYSYYKNTYSKNFERELKYLACSANKFTEIIYEDDCLSWDYALEEHTYLFKMIFKRNISSVSHEFKLAVHQNLRPNECIADFSNLKHSMLELKIMLLSHGVVISSKAKKYLEATTGINCYEFSAIDLVMDNKFYMNVPYEVNLSQISPFKIDISECGMNLCYCGENIGSVHIRGIDPLSNKISCSGVPYYKIAYLGNDRLRIFHRLGCFYKQIHKSCGFCDLEPNNQILSFETIKEVIDDYENCPNIRHYLIGGGSQSPDDNFEFICEIAKYLKKKNGKPIYLMSLPPSCRQTLVELKQAGITEVSFNIEIFNRKLAKEYMPGKGEIPLKLYLDALKTAVELWGNSGNVRTIFIVGLEPRQSLLEGIETVCKIGVSPILSLFKPADDTPLSYILPPSDAEILDIVTQVEHICKTYKVPLGPSCTYCEDNTLKITS